MLSGMMRDNWIRHNPATAGRISTYAAIAYDLYIDTATHMRRLGRLCGRIAYAIFPNDLGD